MTEEEKINRIKELIAHLPRNKHQEIIRRLMKDQIICLKLKLLEANATCDAMAMQFMFPFHNRMANGTVKMASELLIPLAEHPQSKKTMDYLIGCFEADVNYRERKGKTALIAAIRHNRTQNAEYLLDKGANPTLTQEGCEPLYYAIEQDNPYMINLLKRHNVNLDTPITQIKLAPIVIASLLGKEKSVKALLDNKVNLQVHVSKPTKWSFKNIFKPTPKILFQDIFQSSPAHFTPAIQALLTEAFEKHPVSVTKQKQSIQTSVLQHTRD